jgi:hypothetical protein
MSRFEQDKIFFHNLPDKIDLTPSIGVIKPLRLTGLIQEGGERPTVFAKTAEPVRRHP